MDSDWVQTQLALGHPIIVGSNSFGAHGQVIIGYDNMNTSDTLDDVCIKWYKQSAKMSKVRITGYQIQVATNSKFTKNKKTVTVTGYSKLSKKVTKLKAKKKYYVRVRTYTKVNGGKIYSKWSKYKTIKTK